MTAFRGMRRGQMRAAATAAAALCALAVSEVRAAEADVWALMKKPGHIVLLRHAYSPESPPDGDKVDFKDCATQRNLDAEGRAQAARIGDAFRKNGIKTLRLLSSRYCRAMQTGSLLKLGTVRELPALDQVFLADLGDMARTRDETRKFMKTIPAGQLTVLVSHVSNIAAIAGVNLSSGELAVVHMEPSGDVTVDGRIKPPELK
jgi:phosphohistidine phosphatase SixA